MTRTITRGSSTTSSTAPAVVKALATLKAVDDDDSTGAGSFDLILSAESLDRDGERVATKAFEPLPEHISMDIDHGMSVVTTVGSGTPSYDDEGRLRVKGTYASTELGQQVRTLVNEGHVRTASVAFIVREKDSTDKSLITKAELLNGAFTPVPANPDAVILSSKAFAAADQQRHEVLKEGRRNSATDAAHLQDAHDSLVAAGASCSSTKSFTGRPAALKAIVGSIEALQERVRDALRAEHGYGYPRGIVPNAAHDGGTVVFERWDEDRGYASWSQTYTDDGSVVELTGDPVAVDIHEVVAPDADADRSSKSATADPAAKAAGSATADDERTAVEVRLRSSGLTAGAHA